MTSYVITVGYNSAHNAEEVWDELKKVIDDIRKNPKRILDEDEMIEPDSKIPIEYINSYSYDVLPVEDLTIKIVEEGYDEYGQRIVQLASGGGSSRDYKERCRRAVCRIVMRNMHEKGMEININVH